MNVSLHPAADHELAVAVDWYESHQFGLGDDRALILVSEAEARIAKRFTA